MAWIKEGFWLFSFARRLGMRRLPSRPRMGRWRWERFPHFGQLHCYTTVLQCYTTVTVLHHSYSVTPQCYSVTPPAWLPSAPLQHLVLCKTMQRAMRNLVVPTFWAVTPLLHHQPVTLHCYTSSLTTTTCAPRTTTTISAASDLFAKCSPGSIWQRSLIL